MEGGAEEKTGTEEMVVKSPCKNKRDEWSEAAILTLLDIYESKWSLRNRAKLKGSDWEEIALQVSARTSPAVKNPNQCKNKVESMKKKYRLESVTAASKNSDLPSSWQFYARMDQLLKGTLSLHSKVEDLDGFPNSAVEAEVIGSSRELPNLEANLVDDTNKVSDNGPVQDQNCQRIDGERQDRIEGSNGDDNASDSTVPDSRQVSKACKGIKNAREGSPCRRNDFKRWKSSDYGLGESIRLLASSVMKIEEARMEMHRDSERLRLEAEVKRAEMELKRTEIMARTQLQIAKLLATRACNHNDNKSGTSTSMLDVEEPIVGHGMNTAKKNG
ncbi:hypothetical protein LguiA_010121 [Lonicera macranthoides]